MKISTRSRYALRIMLDISMRKTQEYVSLKDISINQEISEKYAEQIINMLNKAGMVQSIRGSKGGYKLIKSPSEYTIGSILRVTEGRLALVPCVEEGENCCDRISTCATNGLWRKINNAISNIVDNMTLQDLVNSEIEIRNKKQGIK